MASLGSTNKLHVSWSDSTFFPWLNQTTVLNYFCNPNNPFYNNNCNNEILRMQNINPDQLIQMTGAEYQLYLSQPPLYVIRKVNRNSPSEVIELAYYYILNGVVYQSPDFLSVVSSRLQTASCHLQDALETIFTNYKYHPSKGYYWSFNQNEVGRTDSKLKTTSTFQHERINSLLHEFTVRYPPSQFTQPTAPNQQQGTFIAPASQTGSKAALATEAMTTNEPVLNVDMIKTEPTVKSPAASGPPEKKIKIGR